MPDRPDSSPAAAVLDRDFLRAIVWRAFLVRAILAVALDWTGASGSLAPDEEAYDVTGWSLAQYWAGDVLVRPWRMGAEMPHGYFYLNGVLYLLFGHTAIPIKILNAVAGAFFCACFYRIAIELFGSAVARRTATYCAYLPSLVLWSSLNIRDVWVILLIAYISWKSLQLVQGYSHAALIPLLGALYLVTTFRDYLFYVLAIPPLLALLLGRRGHLGRNLLLAMLAAGVLLAFLEHGAVGERIQARMSLEALSESRRNLASGGSALDLVDISTPAKALSFLPVGLAYFFFSPLPWEITTVLKALALPEMLFLYALFPAVVRGVRHAIRYRLRDCIQVLTVTALIAASYALGEGNVGTLYRHRAQALGFLLMFGALGRELKRPTQATDAVAA